MAGGLAAGSVARFSSGKWAGLAQAGATLNGSPASIFAISFVSAPPTGSAAGDPFPIRPGSACLLAVGNFDSLGEQLVSNAGILCHPDTSLGNNWVQLGMDTNTSSLSAVYVYDPYVS